MQSFTTAEDGQGLSACDREPIHIPGAIQPHGVLLGLREPDLLVVAASSNLAAACGVEAAAAVQGPLDSLLEPASFAHVAALLCNEDLAGASPFPLRFRGGGPWAASLHRHAGLALLEAEAPPPAEAAGGPLDGGLFADLSGAIERLQAASDQEALWDTTVREVQRLTGFDRVKLYRFHTDWSGEVVAECRAEHMPSYFGLNFPASDIPVQARELYRVNPSRIIPEVGYRPVGLLAAPGLGEIDLTHAQLRSVSPIHLEYLGNMGVGASMSVSVLRGGALWGLIACHHRAPHRVPPDRRQACRLLAQVLAWQLGVEEEAAVARHGAAVRSLEAGVLEETARGRSHREAILRHAETLLGLMDATGFALVAPEEITLIGRTPGEPEVRGLAQWLAGWLATRGEAAFATDRLAELFEPAAAYEAEAAGVLAVPLSRPPSQFMMWFRPEAAQTVSWGGDPNKAVRRAPGAGGRLTPRRSFAAWQEERRGRARAWRPHELRGAGELRDLVLEVLVRRAEELEHMNAQLARSNEELEAFAYVASHDIREPLRQIETFASLLERAMRPFSPPPDARVGRWLDGIEASSRRLRTLIDDLTEFSRLGRHAQPLAPVALAEVLEEAKSDLAQLIAEAGAEVVVAAPLPRVLCDRGQVRQVLQNLLSNAVKYRHPGRAPRITVSAEPEPGPQERAMTRILVADNGIGFEPRHAARIFEPFQRLHSADAYPGSGIGLATCRKIVERHGGRIDADARPGEGAAIAFTLPVAP